MRIVISGVSRGIGEGVARAALDAGNAVLGFGRTNAPWADERPNFTFIQCDMADHAGLAAACSNVVDPVDILLCNAATFANAAWTAETFDPQALSDAFAVNTIAPLIMARALKDKLAASDLRLIVMMSTGNASLQGNTGGAMLGYRLSKSALNQAVRNLAAEWGPLGFKVVALNPGWVKTEMGGPEGEFTVDEVSPRILDFIERCSTNLLSNGCFLNTDGSPLPW